MAVIARPPISPDYIGQTWPTKNTNSQSQKATTQMVTDADQSVRHPVTQRWLSRYQNKQSPSLPPGDQLTKRKGQ